MGKRDEAAGDYDQAARLRGESGLISDEQALNAWLWENGKGRTKPVLVVVATSGGGIAAAYWTASCLVRLEEQLPDFPRRVRLITGASGGMVGAAVYVARLGQPSGSPKPCESPHDVALESITPVVRRMLLVDLPGLLVPIPRTCDRGQALEEAWAKNTRGTTETTFAQLAKAERQGKRPSLIVSPMLIEDAKFLLISNLDLEGSAEGSEFFKLFPKAKDRITLGSALRMNASFPYVSPAVSLPTSTARRVVDAGYLDNYGVRLACEWLYRHRVWLSARTSGVLLVQLRAYPVPPSPDQAATVDRISAGWRFLTSPLEGVASVREEAMRGRNERSVAVLDDWFNSGDLGRHFFRTFVLECDAGPPLGWSLTAIDRARMDDSVLRLADQIRVIAAVVRGDEQL